MMLLLLIISLLSCTLSEYSLSAAYSLSAPNLVDSTSNSLSIAFQEYITPTDGFVLSYEIQYKSLYDREWISYNGNNSVIRPIKLSQVLSVKVDDDKFISSGTFQLALDRNGLAENDELASTRTPLIPFDATSKELFNALNYLENVVVKDVKRCDEFGLAGDSYTGHGGYNGWEFGCPYKSKGGFRWLIDFEVTNLDSYLPKLVVYRSLLAKNTWTGDANQIVISLVQSDAITPGLCQNSICKYTVNNLHEGMPYSFQYRVLTLSDSKRGINGWSSLSKSSDYFFTLEDKVPSRPATPYFESSSENTITLRFIPPPVVQGVESLDVEYQITTESLEFRKWISSVHFDLRKYNAGGKYTLNKQQISFACPDLLPNTQYVFRVRFNNKVGKSAWSIVSRPYQTKAKILMPLTPLPPLISNISSTFIELVILSSLSSDVLVESRDSSFTGGRDTLTQYRLQYHPLYEREWYNSPDIIVFHHKNERIHISIQEISTRSDVTRTNHRILRAGGSPCSGQFWVSYGTVDSTDIEYTVSAPLLFDASSADMKKALMNIPNLNRMNPTIIVHRSPNKLSGYTWRIEIHIDIAYLGGSSILGLQVYRDTLMAEVLSVPTPPYYNNSVSSIIECYSIANPAVATIVDVISDYKSYVDSKMKTRSSDVNSINKLGDTIDNRTYEIQKLSYNLTNLLPNTKYEMRLVTLGTDPEIPSTSVSFITNRLPTYVKGNSLYREAIDDINSYHINSSFDYLSNLNYSQIRDFEVIYVDDKKAIIEWDIDIRHNLPGYPYSFDLEMSDGQYSLEFYHLTTLSVSAISSDSLPTVANQKLPDKYKYTIYDLKPSSYYNVKIIPIYLNGRGRASKEFPVKTLNTAINYWEPIITRIASQVDENIDLVFPSGRRGHSLSMIGDKIYMFGGRTNGASCAGGYKDVFNLGSPDSGRLVYPCVVNPEEVSELWQLDIHSYEWTLVSVVNPEATPYRREQHSAVVINDSIYIFGGKTRVWPLDDLGNPIYTQYANVVYGDLYKLIILTSKPFKLDWITSNMLVNVNNSMSDPVSIPQDRRLFVAIDGNKFNYSSTFYGILDDNDDNGNANSGICIDNIIVRAKIKHTCMSQLRLSLMGPGPNSVAEDYHTNSASYEVLLLNQRIAPNARNTTSKTVYNPVDGCVKGTKLFEFNDDSSKATTSLNPLTPIHYEDEYGADDVFVYNPEGKLSSFLGVDPNAQWTLVVEDMVIDSHVGELINWELDIMISPCKLTAKWVNLTVPESFNYNGTNTSLTNEFDDHTIFENSNSSAFKSVYPVSRYDMLSIAYNQYFFIYGGRDANGNVLKDLYRYNVSSNIWTKLVPINFDSIVLEPASSVGSSFMLTSWGLFRYGGYFRQPYMAVNSDNNFQSDKYASQYVSDVYLMDPVTLRWRRLQPQPWNKSNNVISETVPKGRYLSSSVFIPSLTTKRKVSYRNLYGGDSIPSTNRNDMGTISDSILMFGGFDGTVGSVYDGSSGGLLNDMWMIRLNNMSTESSRRSQEEYMSTHCVTIDRVLSNRNSSRNSCLLIQEADNSTISCDFRNLLLLSWCSYSNQTI